MEWLPLAVAIVGSTGVIGAVTAAIQLSRRARLTRSINAAGKLADQAAPGSPTRLVLQQAIEMDMLRLAAGSIIKIRPRDVIIWAGLAGGIVVSLILTFAGTSLGLIQREAPWAEWMPLAQDPTAKSWSGWAMMMVLVASVGAGLGLNSGVYRAREEFVAAAILEQSPPVVTARLTGLARSWTVGHGAALSRASAQSDEGEMLDVSHGP